MARLRRPGSTNYAKEDKYSREEFNKAERESMKETDPKASYYKNYPISDQYKKDEPSNNVSYTPTSQSAPSSGSSYTPVKTDIVTSGGLKTSGYIINGKTYLDKEGTKDVGEGTYVKTAEGDWYLKNADGTGSKVDNVDPNYGQPRSSRDDRNNDYQEPTQQPQQQPQQEMESSITNIGSTMDTFRTIGSQFAQQSAEHAAAVAAQYENMVGMLDQLEAQVLGQIKSQMGGDDPGLRAAIGLIKDEASRMRDEALEDLNARGLVQSGVYAEMLDRMNRNELTQVQQVVGQRFGDLQNQLNQAIMSMAQARIGALSNHQSTLNSMMTQDRNTMAQIGIQGAQAGLEERGQNLQNTQYYSGLDQNWDIAKMNDATQRYGVDKSYDASIYGTDKQYDASIYGTDKQYASSIYGTNKSYSAATQQANEIDPKLQLERDKFEYTKTMNETERIKSEIAWVQTEFPKMSEAIRTNNIKATEAIDLIQSSPNLTEEAKQYYIDNIKAYHGDKIAQEQNQNNNTRLKQPTSNSFPDWTGFSSGFGVSGGYTPY
jgi:hypothetical protein